MKRNVFFICILISTLLGIIPKNGSCNLISIKELQQTTSEKWTESITVNSEEFDINIPVNVPSVEAIPIINVTGRETDENGIKEYENIGVSLLDKWENAINLFMDKEETKENARVFPYKIQNDFWQIEKENDTINMYAKEQKNSLAFVIDKMEKMFGKIYNCEENEIWIENVQFRKVMPSDYRLFQVADLICTLKLTELKLEAHILSKSEKYFFGDERTLRKNYIKPLSNKEM